MNDLEQDIINKAGKAITNDLHCDGYNTYDNTKIDYFFGNEKDAMWFTLRWSS